MQSVTAGRFYGLFYQWSRIHCMNIRLTPLRKCHPTLIYLRPRFDAFRLYNHKYRCDRHILARLKKHDPRGAEVWKGVLKNAPPEILRASIFPSEAKRKDIINKIKQKNMKSRLLLAQQWHDEMHRISKKESTYNAVLGGEPKQELKLLEEAPRSQILMPILRPAHSEAGDQATTESILQEEHHTDFKIVRGGRIVTIETGMQPTETRLKPEHMRESVMLQMIAKKNGHELALKLPVKEGKAKKAAEKRVKKVDLKARSSEVVNPASGDGSTETDGGTGVVEWSPLVGVSIAMPSVLRYGMRSSSSLLLNSSTGPINQHLRARPERRMLSIYSRVSMYTKNVPRKVFARRGKESLPARVPPPDKDRGTRNPNQSYKRHNRLDARHRRVTSTPKKSELIPLYKQSSPLRSTPFRVRIINYTHDEQLLKPMTHEIRDDLRHGEHEGLSYDTISDRYADLSMYQDVSLPSTSGGGESLPSSNIEPGSYSELTSEEADRSTAEPETSATPDQIASPTSKPPVDADAEQTKLSDDLRKLMRAVPASVVVITTAQPKTYKELPPKGLKGLKKGIAKADLQDYFASHGRGITVSSFTTVTLTPQPIIQFNIKAPSQTLDVLMKTRHFFVHLLQATETGAAIAAAFSQNNSPDKRLVWSSDVYHIRPTLVEPHKLVKDTDSMGKFTDDKYPTALEKKARRDAAGLWVTDAEMDIKRPRGYPLENVFTRTPISFNPQTLPPKEDQEGIKSLPPKLYLPRIGGYGILRVLQCKVLDRGMRGARGDGFVKVGDHMIVIAHVHEILGDFLYPIDVIRERKVKSLTYAHGDFTATTGSSILTPKEGESDNLVRPPDKNGEEFSNDRPSSSFIPDHFRTQLDSAESDEERSLELSMKHAVSVTAEDRSLEPSMKHDIPDPTETGKGPVFRKIASKGKSLREITELAEYYAHKSLELTSQMNLLSAARLFSASKDDPKIDRSNFSIERLEGPRIFKHVSQRGTSLDEVLEMKEISKELEVPHRIAQAAIEALPDAGAEERKRYAVIIAAEELAARRAEIEDKRLKAKAKAKFRAEIRPRERSPGQLTVYKYESTDTQLDPDLEPKLDKVWEDINKSKTLEEEEKAREEFERMQNEQRLAKEDERPPPSMARVPYVSKAMPVPKRDISKMSKDERKALRERQKHDRKERKRLNEEEKNMERKGQRPNSVYQDPDPFAEMFK